MKISISLKLIACVSALVMGLTASITYFNSEFLEKSIIQREKDFNLFVIETKLKEIENFIDVKLAQGKSIAEKKLANNIALQNNLDSNLDSDLLGFEIYKLPDSSQIEPEVKSIYANNIQNLINKSIYTSTIRSHIKKITDGHQGVLIFNSTSLFKQDASNKKAVITMLWPYSKFKNRIYEVIALHIDALQIQKYFSGNSLGELSLYNQQGHSLASSDESVLHQTYSIAGSSLYDFISNHPLTYYSGEKKNNNTSYVVSFVKSKYGFFLTSQIPTATLLAPAKMISYMTIRISGYFLAGSLFLLFLFSLTLTRPLEKLALVTLEIAKGNFDKIPTEHLGTIFKDEVHVLSVSVERMLKGLKERDKFKNLFNKFHGSAITADLMKSEITLHGERKDVFVFFSDLRGFTKMSENESPEHVVNMLNEYFSYMVPIINKYGGVVDKFIGDAIMAVWGIPQSQANEGEKALMACIEMRAALAQLNEIRIARGDSPLWLGMALHYGEAISGTIGSAERMEYTVIGNTVNTASRIEASTKSFGTDLLVSAEVKNSLPSFLYTTAGEVQVKGKNDSLLLYKVLGYINEENRDVYISTAYSDYEAEDADKVKITG